MMKKFCKEFLPYIIILIVVLLIKLYVFSLVRVNGPSMETTLLNNDIMILDKISYKFSEVKRFDIVVIDLNDELIIKRVVGLPGEKIKYKDNKLYINDKLIDYNFKHSYTDDFELDEVIPSDCYYVLGDNRLNSSDSRIFGVVHRNKIKGKAVYTLFPFSRFGNKK